MGLMQNSLNLCRINIEMMNNDMYAWCLLTTQAFMREAQVFTIVRSVDLCIVTLAF